MTNITTFTVTGDAQIHCAGCASRITRALRCVAGIENVQASVNDQQVVVTFEPTRVSPEDIQVKLAEIGYGVTPERET